MNGEDTEGGAVGAEDAEYWAAVEELADETLRPYAPVLPVETLEMMKCVMVATIGAHPEVEALTREIVRRRLRPIGGGGDGGRPRVVLVK